MKNKIFAIVILSLLSVSTYCQTVKSYKQLPGGIIVTSIDGTLGIYPLANNAVRIKFFKDADPQVPEIIFTTESKNKSFKVSDSPSKIQMKAGKITVSLDKQSGSLTFADNNGNTFLSEKKESRKLLPDTVMGEKCFRVELSFESPADESIFGLGQFQDGHYNLRNITRRLTQVNSQISIPFIFSSKGYGLLWHQYGLTDFNPADNFITLEKQEQSTGNNQSADVTTTSGTQRRSQNQSVYNGTFKVPSDGVYSIFVDYGDMESRHSVNIDGKPCIDQSNMWLPPTVSTLINLTAGDHKIQLACKASNKPKISWKLKDDLSTFRSPNAKLLDYVVFYGPSADSVIATYRNLSGNVPMLPLWAYGFWQCRERYSSGTNLVETVKEFRKRNIPMDVIVQDWQYWGKYGWGVPKFDETNYPNPAGFIKELHDLNAHFSVSVWENLDKKSEIGKGYDAKNLYISNSPWVDIFNPLAQETHWNALNQNLFAYGVDSWWMDATEPENDALKGKQTYFGPGDFYRLTYPLFVSKAVYEGQRKASSDKRVCILTRSAFLGQQRYGMINWSGDVGSTWDAYKRQIVAGLNYTITGLPYWTTDIGGFFRPRTTQYADEKFHDLLTRWYQWGAFNPIFRIHGYQSETEPWKFGQQVEDNMRKMLNLRYRLLLYIYSEAWQVTKNGATIMRPLVMDFSGDTSALDKPFEFMFGKAFLVAPVTEPDIKEWPVYLPESAVWYDFWTARRYDGGQTINTPAPLDKIPLFVKAGSVVPMGKYIQYAGQKSADTLEIRIYKGSDGKFELYEDENDNYNYERGVYSTIDFKWSDASHTLTIGKRNGEFPGMLKTRTFRIIVVSAAEGTGVEETKKNQKEVIYSGKKKKVVLR
jgi:alpha-D-xyloside xylohydrolase